MSKPFHFAELLARIRLRIRTEPAGASSPVVVEAAGMSLDLRSRGLTVDGKTVNLTAREFTLMETLLRHPGQVLTREQLLSHRDRFTPTGATFRQFGPLARFDHHTSPFGTPAMDPDGRSVIYLAEDLATSACEVFGEAGVAPLCSNWRVALVRPLREIATYDLDYPGAAMAIGALPALASGNENRYLTQQWARAIYEDQPAATKVEGIHYRSAYHGGGALALWDCEADVEVATGHHGPLDLPLDSGLGRRLLLQALHGTGIPVTPVPDADCAKCQSGK